MAKATPVHAAAPPRTDRAKPPVRRSYGLRWGGLVAAIILFNIAASFGLTALTDGPLGTGADKALMTGLLLLLLYAVLLAIPFVPGVEIGISMLVMQGSAAAPFVYAATILGLCFSFFLGRAFSRTLPCGFLKTMGLPRACDFVDRMKDLDRQGRLALLEDAAPAWIGTWLLQRRYLLLAVLLNIPGNSFVGGGGGIVLVAGLSRLFSRSGTVVTIALATAPVPALVYFFGPDLLW
jgi:hypothetical protein